MSNLPLIDLRTKIQDVANFPKEGILFKDITPLLRDPQAFDEAVSELAKPFLQSPPDVVVGVESRGFIFAAPVAHKLGAGLVPVRKLGKLPRATFDVAYDLEYGTAVLSIHQDAVKKGEKVLIVDDVLATGGTVEAVLKLLEQAQAHVVGLSFLIELTFLNGRDKLPKLPIFSLLSY